MAELTREILVRAEPSTVFAFLIEPGMQAWLGTEIEFDARPGGTYRALMGGTHWGEGKFLEVEPDRRVVFSFGWAEPDHPIPPGSTTVEIALEAVDGGTAVRLTHRGLPEDAVGDHTGGWDHYLARLAVTAVGGDAGPDIMG